MSATQSPAPEGAKGFLCPVGQLCIVSLYRVFILSRTALLMNGFWEQEGQNPFNGTNSFDNVFASALQVVVVASGAWTCEYRPFSNWLA